jgi:hypothetical protein
MEGEEAGRNGKFGPDRKMGGQVQTGFEEIFPNAAGQTAGVTNPQRSCDNFAAWVTNG